MEAERKKGHEAIAAAFKAVEQLGYLVGGINYQNGRLDIACYCLHPNEGSNEVKI
jgi:hypothetical protein